jgi:hypothetical protein
MSPEPTRRILNPESPTSKQVTKTPLPPLHKNEWDAVENTNSDTFVAKDLDNINNLLDKIAHEDNNQNNS